MMNEENQKKILVDLEGYEPLIYDHGDRFRGWYMSKEELRKEVYPLNYEQTDTSYEFKVFDYNIKFIMPMKIEFSEGMIAYSDPERHLGIFRFPQKENGRFSAPVSMNKIKEDLQNLTDEQVVDLLKNRKVLTFEAFRIPQYGFEYVGIDDMDLDRIAKLTDRSFARAIRAQFEQEINHRISEVKEKIKSGANYLLILQNVLDFQLKDMAEVSHMTNNIIHV